MGNAIKFCKGKSVDTHKNYVEALELLASIRFPTTYKVGDEIGVDWSYEDVNICKRSIKLLKQSAPDDIQARYQLGILHAYGMIDPATIQFRKTIIDTYMMFDTDFKFDYAREEAIYQFEICADFCTSEEKGIATLTATTAKLFSEVKHAGDIALELRKKENIRKQEFINKRGYITAGFSRADSVVSQQSNQERLQPRNMFVLDGEKNIANVKSMREPASTIFEEENKLIAKIQKWKNSMYHVEK